MKRRWLAYILMLADLACFSQSDKADSLTKLLNQPIESVHAQIDLLNQLAFEIIYSKPGEAFSALTEARRLADSVNDQKGIAKSLQILGIYYYLKPDYDKAVELTSEAVSISLSTSDSLSYANGLNNLGNIYWAKENYDSALFLYHEALQVEAYRDNPSEAAKTEHNIGLIYFRLHVHDKALQSFIKALLFYREAGDVGNTANCLLHIGNVFNNQDNYAVALKNFYQALELFDQCGQHEGTASCLINIGQVHSKNQLYDLALADFKKAAAIYDELQIGKGKLAEGYAKVYLGLGEYDLARTYLDQAYEYFTHLGSKAGLGRYYQDLSHWYWHLNRIPEAIENAKKSLDLVRDSNNSTIKMQLYRALSDYYQTIGNQSSAASYLTLYKEVAEERLNERVFFNLDSLIMDYEIQLVKSEADRDLVLKSIIHKQEIDRQRSVRNILLVSCVLLTLLIYLTFRSLRHKRKLNEDLERQKQQIEEDHQKLLEYNNTQNQLFKILAHDLRGPLGSIQNLGELLWEGQDELDHKKQKSLINAILRDSKETFNLVDNLLLWASNSSGKLNCKLETIDLHKLVNDSLRLIKTRIQQKDIAIANQVDPQLKASGDLQMLKTIMRNLLNNALKFTSPGGHIHVRAQVGENNMVSIGVLDSGVGISDATLKTLFSAEFVHSTRGTMQEKGSGLGLKLCKELVELNGGTIWATSELGVGSAFWFTLPQSDETNLNAHH